MTWTNLIPLGSNFPLSWRVSAIMTAVCGAWTDYVAGWKPRNKKAVQWSSKGLCVGNATAPSIHSHTSHRQPRNLSSSVRTARKSCLSPRPWRAKISHLTWLLGNMSIQSTYVHTFPFLIIITLPVRIKKKKKAWRSSSLPCPPSKCIQSLSERKWAGKYFFIA